MQKHVNLVDLVKSFPTNIFLQNLASIQKRTSALKFAHLAEESGNDSIPNLSTKFATVMQHISHMAEGFEASSAIASSSLSLESEVITWCCLSTAITTTGFISRLQDSAHRTTCAESFVKIAIFARRIVPLQLRPFTEQHGKSFHSCSDSQWTVCKTTTTHPTNHPSTTTHPPT